MNFFIKKHLKHPFFGKILLTVKLTVIYAFAFITQLQAAVPDVKLLISHAEPSFKQPAIQINGTVKDNKGELLPGVNVSVKGTKIATITDANGRFILNLNTINETLVFTYMGFETKEIKVAGRNNLSVVLEEQASALDEVVVVGYGTMKKKDLTSAVSSVKAEDIALSPVASPMEALQGRVSGLDIQRGSGRSGETPSVLLRGNRSLTASSAPLYIVDGIPQSNIDNLNPNDIESIDILKDASATAIYGVNGANGIITVTTKKAKAGKVQIDVNSYYGVNGFASFPKPLQGEAWLNYHRDKFFLDNDREATDLTDLGFTQAGINAIEQGQWVDWVDQVLQNGVQQNHHLSVRGGTEKTQAYLSVGLIGEKGIYANDRVDSYNSRGGIAVNFNNIFKAGFQSILNYRTSNSTNSRVNQAYSMYPLGVPYDENGEVNLRPIEGDNNVISILANNYPGAFSNQARNFNLQFNPYVEISPVKNLTLRSNFGANLGNSRRGEFQGLNSFNALRESWTDSRITYSTGMNYSYIWENILNYNFNVAKDHQFALTGVTSWADNRSESSYLSGLGLDYEEFMYYNMGAVKNMNSYGNGFIQTKRMSYAGRMNYSYKGKYLLQATGRWDGISQLAEGNKWDFFPSASAAWRISEEKFMEGTKAWLSNLKLRVGHGIAGQGNIPAYVSLTEAATKTPATNLSLGGTAVLPVYAPTQYIANADLTWERSATTNIGLDVSFFNDRIDLTAEYYETETTGILWNRKLPMTSGGFDGKTAYIKTSNIGASENKGIEFTIGSRNIIKKDFQWNSFLTFTRAKEKLTGIDLGKLTPAELVSEGLFVGEPARGVHYGYKKLGIWQIGEEEEAAKYGAAPGDLKLQTVEKFDAAGVSDGGVHIYSTADRMVVGNEVPDWMFGLQNTFKYKALDLTVFMNARYGQMIDAQVLGYWNRVSQPETYDYWMPDNPTNDFPRPGGGFNTQFEQALRLVDGSYLKIKNITLGYTLPNRIGNRFGIERMRIYGTAYNPFIFTRSHLLKDVDPESGGTDSFPLFKQLVFGINFSL